ncbi:hypothetical protein ACJJTC_015659 [Scirpophaga incertulas]
MDVEGALTGGISQGSTLKLEGTKNFHTWKFQQKVMMKALNVFGVIDGTLPSLDMGYDLVTIHNRCQFMKQNNIRAIANCARERGQNVHFKYKDEIALVGKLMRIGQETFRIGNLLLVI